jgi:hypothetical protein
MDRILLVHLSDLHMGSIFNGFYSPSAVRSGFNGHDIVLCRRLRKALRDLPNDPDVVLGNNPLYFVVTGDLTCTGLETDVTTAYTYLLAHLVEDGSGVRCGLSVAGERLWTIPGNHDHWNGNHSWPQPAYNGHIFRNCYRQTPWRDTVTSPGGQLQLHLFGVDSNSGLAWHSTNGRAGGSLSYRELDRLSGLEKLLTDSDAARQQLPAGVHQVRAVLCHHSFSNLAQSPPGALARLKRAVSAAFFGKMPDPLDAQSRQALIDLAHQYSVKAILTGHAHFFWDEPHPPPGGGAAVWELRSSTPVQGPTPEPDDESATQGFFLHEIRLEDGAAAPAWRYKKYQYSGGTFVPQAGWLTAY